MRARVALVVVLAAGLLLRAPAQTQTQANILLLQMESAHFTASILAVKAIQGVVEKDPRNQVFEEYIDGSGLGADVQALQNTLHNRYRNARQSVNLALRILGGESTANFPIDLEPGTWEQYRNYFLVGVAILTAEALLVAILIFQMIRRKRSDNAIRELTGRVINAAEEERRHIARELHDDIGQRLSLMSLQISLSLHQPTAETSYHRTVLADSLRELDALITDVHDLSHRLHSAKLEHLGLTTTLQDLCQRLSRQHGLQIELQAENVPSHVPREVSLCFYRIAQEALSNVIRHSGSSTVLATVNESDGNLRMQIQDFGVGFDTTRQASGLGLATMQERLRTVGGKFSIVSHRGKGTVVTAEADLKASRKAA